MTSRVESRRATRVRTDAREARPLRVMAVDPGKVTGIAWCELPAAWKAVGGVRSVQSSFADGSGGVKQVTGPTEPHRAWAIIEEVGELEPDVVVLEDFRLFPGERHSPDMSGTEPMRLIAMIDFMWWLAKQDEFSMGLNGEAVLPKLVKQMPGERYAIKPAQLRAWKLWRTPKQGGGKDAMAALQHMLLYIQKESGR